MGSSQSTSPGDQQPKKSLYRKYQDKKAPKPIPDEDLLKYTGKTREQITTWAETQPGVGKNQLAGKATMGSTSGLGGLAIAEGYGGWGPSSEPRGANRGMKFPPRDLEAEQKAREASK